MLVFGAEENCLFSVSNVDLMSWALLNACCVCRCQRLYSPMLF
jgi:hypothetical protein